MLGGADEDGGLSPEYEISWTLRMKGDGLTGRQAFSNEDRREATRGEQDKGNNDDSSSHPLPGQRWAGFESVGSRAVEPTPKP